MTLKIVKSHKLRKMNNTMRWADYDFSDDSLPEIPQSWFPKSIEKKVVTPKPIKKKKITNPYSLLCDSDSEES